MDLTDTMDLSQSASQPSIGQTEPLLVTDTVYETESTGHRHDTPIVHLRCRRPGGGLRVVEVEGFRPYFYITLSEFVRDPLAVLNDRRVLGVEGDFQPGHFYDQDRIPVPQDVSAQTVADILSDEGSAQASHTDDPVESLHDDSLVRIVCTDPDVISGADGIRDYFDQTFEADIPFVRRFMISTGITRGVEVPQGPDRVQYENWDGESDSPGRVQDIEPCEAPSQQARVCTVDIEVATHGGGFPEPHRARNEITAIGAHDSYRDEYKLWGLVHGEWDADEDDLDAMREDIVAGADDEFGLDVRYDDIQLFGDETELLDAFHDWYLECDPDILTGWNSQGFDVPYLIQRSYAVNALQVRDWPLLGKPATWSEEYDGDQETNYQLEGVCTLDMLDAYKKTQYRNLDSYRLDAVAKAELGHGKVDLAGDELDEAWEDDPVEFFVYNLRDVEAVVEIEDSSGLVDLYENLREVTGALYETCNHNGPMIDTLYLRRAHENGLALPTNEEPEETVYHGAKVFETKPGVHKNCVYPDLSSMYPSILAMLNLGVETIIGNEDDLAQSEYTEEDCFTFPVDNRPFKTVPKGEPIDGVDRDKYKGVKSEEGGLREMFDPQHDWLYVLRPEVKEAFVRETVDELIDLKNEYSGDLYSAVKRVTNCFTPDTEVVTPRGVRNIQELEVGDLVYSIDPDTQEVETKPVTDVHAYPDYEDEILEMQTRDMDFGVTPNHRMLVRKDNGRQSTQWDGYQFVEAGDLDRGSNYELPNDWEIPDGEQLETVSLADLTDREEFQVWANNDVHGRTFITNLEDADPDRRKIGGQDNSRMGYRLTASEYRQNREYIHEHSSEVYISAGTGQKWIPMEYDGDDFIQLLAWFITEGSIYTSTEKVFESGTRGESTMVNIAQEDASGRDSVGALLDRMNINAYIDDRSYQFTGKILAEIFEDLCGDDSFSKHLPDLVWDLSQRQKQLLFDTLVEGDGDSGDGRYRYTTSSDQLRDDFMQLAIHVGRNPRYNRDSGSWRIYFSETQNTLRPRRSMSSTTAEDGVYCVTVEDNHTLMAGRNGKFQWVGQSIYGVMGDSDSAGGKGFRLYDREVAEGITLAGRLTISFTAEEFTGYLQEHHDPDAMVVGGDTDSAVSTIPNAPDLQTAFQWAENGVDHVEERYDDFVQEQFDLDPDVDENRLAVELESLASALFFMAGDETTEYSMGEDGYLQVERGHESVRKRYAQHLVWDDDDGWLDTPDAEDYPGDALADSEDLSQLKHEETVTYDHYEDDGPLGGQEPMANVDITGFEYVRSDSAQITRDAQLQVLTDILLAPDPRDRIEPYLRDLRDDLLGGEIPLSELARPKGMSKKLDNYGWKEIDELDDDEITPEVEAYGGKYTATPGPAYRGAKYADDHFPWEELDTGAKPQKVPIETVRSNNYPAVYDYVKYPEDERPDPPEVGREVDALAVEHPDRIPDEFVVDYEKICEKELKGKTEDILETIGLSWGELMQTGQQSSLEAWG